MESYSNSYDFQDDNIPTNLKMGDFIEPGTQSTNIKVNIETLWKKSEMYLVFCIESKDFIYSVCVLLTNQLDRTLKKKIINHFQINADFLLLNDDYTCSSAFYVC